MPEDKKDRIEQCPLIGHCIDRGRLSDMGVCEGKKGNFRKCTVHDHYAEQDYQLHNPRLKGEYKIGDLWKQLLEVPLE